MEKKKNNFWRRGLALVLALSLVAGTFLMLPTKAADTSVLGNLIDSFTSNTTTVFNLSSTSRFYFTEEPTGDLLQTVQLVQRQFAADELPSASTLDIVWNGKDDDADGIPDMLKSGDIWIKLVDKSVAPAGVSSDEGYCLEVGSYAVVTAYGVDGLLYGLNMLHKHFRNADTTSIKGFTAIDTPDTKERTVQLDCARKYLTVEYVCNFIKEASWMGYNTLQLHVSEDGGFRADFWDEDYYVKDEFWPENDFSWICGSHVQSWVKDETDVDLPNYRNDPDKNKYLTTAELIQIINTCKEYHIDIIPSFDSPAHMDYITWKFEQNYKSNTSYSFTYNGTTYKAADTNGCINYNGTTGSSTPEWPYYTAMDIRDGYTRGNMSQAFVFNIYEDMAEFFSYYAGSTKFNIGTDEVNLKNSPNAWSYSLFPGYVNELNALLKERGYTVRMFNDFINDDNVSDFDSDIEILYWNSAYNSITGTEGAYDEPAVSSFVNDGRILYNCINLHTYYVLRTAPNGKGGSGNGLTTSNGDARSENCYQWEFYAATEEGIYNKWTPNNIRKDGVYTEPDAIVPDDQLGGAYFLTWHDYAAVNTETEIWNGVYDTVNSSGEFYSVRYRMWSNIIKQWNWDIDDTLTYANFASIRNTLGDFPGLESDTYSDASYAKATSLPDATDPIQLGDHATLTAALASGKIAKGYYTDASYAAYETAYNAAVETNNDNSATDEELTDALNTLNAAIAGLTIKSYKVTIEYKANINGTETSIKSIIRRVPAESNEYEIFISPLEGYSFLRADGSTFTLSESGDGSGYLTGSVTADMTITLWYESTMDNSRLNALLAKEITSQTVGSTKYTDASWTAYTTALANAKNFAASVNSKQSDVDTLISALEAAMTALVTSSSDTYMEIEFLNSSFVEDRQIGLYIKTSPNIKSITVKNATGNFTETLTNCSGEVQTLDDGTVVKYWNVFFNLRTSGDVTYEIIGTYTVGNTDKTISETVSTAT